MKTGNQLDFAFEPPKTRGGKRRGAGRKRSGPRSRVPHTREHKARHPVHVTQRIADSVLAGAGLRTLRRRDVYKIIYRAFVHGCKRDAVGGKFRICQYSVQRDHMHLVVEADSKTALSRGMQAFAIRVAKGVDRVSWRCIGRRGQVFGDRYHAQVATSPRQTRNILSYVILNARKHGEHTRAGLPGLRAGFHSSTTYIDPYSSAHYFDGFTRNIGPPPGGLSIGDAVPVAPAKTWLLGVGWRQHGLIPPDATPGRS